MAGHRNVSTPPASVHGERPCRLCGAALSPLERVRGDTCGRLPCRQQIDRQRAMQARDAELARRRASAAQRWRDSSLTSAPVVWIVQHQASLVPVPRALRQAHQTHLEGLAAVLASDPDSGALEPTPSPADDSALAGPLCTFCAGRCCRWGAGSHAFITARLLRRWLAEHPGSTPAEAAAAYLSRLPRQHVEGSCLHHGRQGCTLPREMRSEVCNRYTCEGLRDLQDHDSAGRSQRLLAAMDQTHALGDMAWLSPEGFRRVPRLPRRRRA